MNWLNLHVSTMRRAEYVGSEPVQRATWLNVLSYCCELENAGRIVGARTWKDRQWQQTCGVMLAEVNGATPLLTWEGDDLVVWAYPVAKQEEVAGRRSVAQENGKRGGRPPKNTVLETHEKPTLVSENNQRCKAEGERKEKGKEGEGNGAEAEAEKPKLSGPEIFMAAWNELPGPFPKIKTMPADRLTALRVRMSVVFWRDNWRLALARMTASGFCKGANDRGWVADPDFFLKPATVARILEGKYDDKNGRPRDDRPASFRAPMNKPPERPEHAK